MEYDLTCDCQGKKFPMIERAIAEIHSYSNKIFKALLSKNCIK